MAEKKNIRKDRFTAQESDFVFDKLVVNGKEVKPGQKPPKKPTTPKKTGNGGKK